MYYNLGLDMPLFIYTEDLLKAETLSLNCLLSVNPSFLDTFTQQPFQERREGKWEVRREWKRNIQELEYITERIYKEAQSEGCGMSETGKIN